MLLGASPLGVYTLTQLPGGGGSATLEIAKGDLTLAGSSIALTQAVVAAKGDLTLTGNNIAFAPVLAIITGTLTLVGQSAAFLVTETITKENLTLAGGSIDLNVTEPVAQGRLTLTGYATSFAFTFGIQPGNLTLTGQSGDIAISYAFFLDGEVVCLQDEPRTALVPSTRIEEDLIAFALSEDRDAFVCEENRVWVMPWAPREQEAATSDQFADTLNRKRTC